MYDPLKPKQTWLSGWSLTLELNVTLRTGHDTLTVGWLLMIIIKITNLYTARMWGTLLTMFIWEENLKRKLVKIFSFIFIRTRGQTKHQDGHRQRLRYKYGLKYRHRLRYRHQHRYRQGLRYRHGLRYRDRLDTDMGSDTETETG